MPDWIAWQKGLTRKREVLQIASLLQVSRHEAAALCMEAWEWADDNTVDGYVEGITAVQLSDSLCRPGLGEALVAVGWLVEDPGGIMFVNWERWNSETAKARLQAAKRQMRKRRRDGEDGIGAKRRRMSR